MVQGLFQVLKLIYGSNICPGVKRDPRFLAERFKKSSRIVRPVKPASSSPSSSGHWTRFLLSNHPFHLDWLHPQIIKIPTQPHLTIIMVLQAFTPRASIAIGRRIALPSGSSSSLAINANGLRQRFYHQKVIDHYENPRNVGSFPKTDLDVGTGLVGAPACGDVMKLQIKVNSKGIISDVRFKTFGCGSAIASSSYMTERVKGMTLQEAGAIRNTEIAKELSLPPVKLHCSMLAEDAIKAAIRDYQKKLEESGATKADGFIEVSQSATTGETIATARPNQKS
ncbi:hypothetical protein O181_032424 [Austropuccinia psidii MF-1]|uniref:Iron-sulfur cluster assembly protein n=1 Tax=Austropuccinia psidii MF-1 TaxID=1389203 RepID=A0A9Q3CXE7_9BASI|nr:hypothetical protein [Austropuccinia psidii MF-1]